MSSDTGSTSSFGPATRPSLEDVAVPRAWTSSTLGPIGQVSPDVSFILVVRSREEQVLCRFKTRGSPEKNSFAQSLAVTTGRREDLAV